MDKVILEFIKDSGKHPDYRVYHSMNVKIGRGYENDLIVSDPYVSQAHCVIRVHEDGFSVQDLGSLNGTWVIKNPVGGISNGKSLSHQKVDSSCHIVSGEIVIVGHTKIRFLHSGHELEPAKPILKPSAFFEEISSAPKSWLIVLSSILLACAVEHQESFKNLPVSRFFSIGIGLLLTFLIWSGIWSFVGWLIKRKAFFNAHLSWVALFFLSMTLFYPLADHLGYVFSSPMVEMIAGALIFWLFIGALLAGHLMLATVISRKYQIGVAVGISTVVILFGVVTYFAGRPQFNPQPELYGTLIPPYARLVAGQSVNQWIEASQNIFVQKKHE
ncbi:MAG: FHA domain-containing protein [Candidatus Omnitrophica bacterium]|nr:FHA domain-containing protein [Candidatus Omnitrophota bacterium]